LIEEPGIMDFNFLEVTLKENSFRLGVSNRLCMVMLEGSSSL